MFVEKIAEAGPQITRPKGRHKQSSKKADAVAIKTASAAQLFFPGMTPAASATGGVLPGGGGGTRQAHGEVFSNEASGTKHKTQKEFTATMETSAKETTPEKLSTRIPGSRCIVYIHRTFIVARKHGRESEKSVKGARNLYA